MCFSESLSIRAAVLESLGKATGRVVYFFDDLENVFQVYPVLQGRNLTILKKKSHTHTEAV